MHSSEPQASLEWRTVPMLRRQALMVLRLTAQRGSLDAVLRLCICTSHARSQLVWSDDDLFVEPAGILLQYSGVSGPLANVTMH